MVALDEVQKGHTYICKEIQAAFSGQEIIGEGVEVARHFLSKRELEIVRYIKKGYSSKEIASQLYLSVKTVEVHRYNILKKLNLKNSAALVHFISQQSVDLFI